MPGFHQMPVEQRLELLEYVKSFNKGFWDRHEIKTIVIPDPPPMTPERVARGLQLYKDAECLACHGESGRGMARPRRRSRTPANCPSRRRT
jgi:cytochrome c